MVKCSLTTKRASNSTSFTCTLSALARYPRFTPNLIACTLVLKSKNDITLADIHRLFDGAIALLPCASLNFYERCSDCADESECLLRHGLITIREETLKAMEGITIASLVKK